MFEENNLENLNFDTEIIDVRDYDNMDDFIAAKVDTIPAVILAILPKSFLENKALFALQLKWMSEYYDYNKNSIRN